VTQFLLVKLTESALLTVRGYFLFGLILIYTIQLNLSREIFNFMKIFFNVFREYGTKSSLFHSS